MEHSQDITGSETTSPGRLIVSGYSLGCQPEIWRTFARGIAGSNLLPQLFNPARELESRSSRVANSLYALLGSDLFSSVHEEGVNSPW